VGRSTGPRAGALSLPRNPGAARRGPGGGRPSALSLVTQCYLARTRHRRGTAHPSRWLCADACGPASATRSSRPSCASTTKRGRSPRPIAASARKPTASVSRAPATSGSESSSTNHDGFAASADRVPHGFSPRSPSGCALPKQCSTTFRASASPTSVAKARAASSNTVLLAPRAGAATRASRDSRCPFATRGRRGTCRRAGCARR
jgi:hypothetical protein